MTQTSHQAPWALAGIGSRAHDRYHRREGGSVSLQVVMFTPVLFFTVVMIVYAGHVAMARQSFAQVAAAAARTASLARTDAQARADAAAAAQASLAALDLRCDGPPVVTVSGSVAATVPGQTVPGQTVPGQIVQATVTCQVSAADSWVPFRAVRTLTATAASPVDVWRGR